MAAAFACIACRVRFSDFNEQRIHHQSEWHRYNLKRNVVQLPPVSQEAFHQLKEIHDKSQEEPSKQNHYCEVCRKQFGNEKAFDQHLQSKRHKQVKSESLTKPEKKVVPNVEKKDVKSNITPPQMTHSQGSDSESESDWTDVDENDEVEGNAIPPTDCLFCPFSSQSIEDNVQHMSNIHSFFIPDVEYLSDLEGLLTYLGEKVGIGYRCLWCGDSGKSFNSVIAAQRHMHDKGHCKVRYEPGESLLEYSDFYDYSTSYPDAVNADKDEEINENEIEENDDWQLVLPSGAVIGHRSLFKYYRQNLKPITENGQRVRKSIVNKIMSNYKALGWTGTTGEAAIQRAKDIKFFHKIRAKHSLKVQQKHNKLLQPHFRSQIGF
ncbi:zinc finger protein 622-like protein [Leptotrombidium deliense]|uniref:Zinc finger protein 622-like protein n=1 Tax=Leptotrombidium deliense TaxID=299467 RepID=A0A443SMU2_9ACAR|nr:zinc finger protein 622-like protein [Leptotrombidium deliense]